MRVILLFFLSLFLGACDTANQSRILQRDRSIEADMRERYDFGALAAFLRQVIADHPVFEQVNLTSTKIGDSWHIERVDPPSRMRNGDWVIWDSGQGNEEFELYLMFDPKDGRTVSIRVKRLAKDRFQLIGLSLDQFIELGQKK
jgi:hypothetical protein